jgi:hypothetical protein
MASRSSYIKSKKRVRGENAELVPVRSNVFYGLQTKLVDQQKTSIERDIIVTPNITFYDNYTKAFIDFSDYLNNPDKSNIKPFFDLLTKESTFTMSNGTWLNPVVDKLTYDLSGTYKFSKIVDGIVFVEVISLETYSTTITRYDKKYFAETPIISFTTTVLPDKTEVKSYINNFLGQNSKNSFAYLGIRKGDYLQIQNTDIRYKVDSISIDAEGKETVVVFGDLGINDFIGTPILITLQQINTDKKQINYDNTILGKCELTQNSAIIECLDNHTLLQSKLREDTFNGITSRFVAGEYCTKLMTNTELVNSQAIVNKLKAENLVLTNIKTQPTATTTNSSLFSSTNLITNLFSS